MVSCGGASSDSAGGGGRDGDEACSSDLIGSCGLQELLNMPITRKFNQSGSDSLTMRGSITLQVMSSPTTKRPVRVSK